MNASTLALYAALAIIGVLYMARRRNRLKSEE